MADYNLPVDNSSEGHLGRIIKQQRVAVQLTLQELASKSGVSSSHLGRIERGERSPSARTLRRIANPLGFGEDELFTLAGYLSPHPSIISESSRPYTGERLDPYVATVLSRETLEVQHAVLGILSILKGVAKGMNRDGS